MSKGRGIFQPNIEAFLSNFDKNLDGNIGAFQQEAYDEGYPIISQDVAMFLNMILKIKKPKAILEVGCAIGFSASFFAGVACQVTTIERYGHMANLARKNFEARGISHKIRLIEEDAKTALPKLVADEERFDFIFLDCAKGQYVNLLLHALELLEGGGILCVDDILQDATIAKPREEIIKRQRTIHKNMQQFLDDVMANPDLQSIILPIGDGLLFSIKGGICSE